MKIYTKTGDQGETGLLGGLRVAKSHVLIQICGELDATNSAIGLARSWQPGEQCDQILERIQTELFILGGRVAAAHSESQRIPNLPADAISWLESTIDQLNERLPPMDAFILPGGCPPAAQLHWARTQCRQAERTMVRFTQEDKSLAEQAPMLAYLNRLSDLLFVMARFVNHDKGNSETKWLPSGPTP